MKSIFLIPLRITVTLLIIIGATRSPDKSTVALSIETSQAETLQEKNAPIVQEAKPVVIEKTEPVKQRSVTQNSYTVYVTKSGKKYHKNTCRTLKGGITPIQRAGYTACSVCRP